MGVGVTSVSLNNPGLPGNGDFAAFCAKGAGSDAFTAGATASPTTLNVGQTSSLTATGGTAYTWQAPEGLTLSSTTGSVISATATSPGVKTLTVIVSNGGSCTAAATVSLTVGAAPMIPTLSGFAASPATACVGSPVTFTATVGNVSGSYSYTLTNGNNPITGSSSNMAFSQSLTASGTGTQSYTLTVSSNGQGASATTSLTVSGLSPDYQPLVDLYNATNGPGWTNNTGWLSGCDPCTGNGGNPWFGVTCSNGRVIRIGLPTNNLSGTLPPSLSALTNLHSCS